MTRAAEREEDAMQVKVKKELFSSLFRKEESIRIVFTSADQAQVCVHAVIVFLPLHQRLAVCACVCMSVCACVSVITVLILQEATTALNEAYQEFVQMKSLL